MITAPIYTLSADMFDYHEGTMTADVAALDVLDDYDSNRYHFYCSACAHQDHYTRLVPVKSQSQPKSGFNAPRRYNLFNHKDSTHICDLPARYRAVDNMAHRYNAHRVGAHQYGFSDRLPDHQTLVRVDNEYKTIDRASRLAAITYFLMYDQDLMTRQKLSLEGASQKFRDAFFDASAEDKKRIFRQALAATSASRSFTTAAIFQPNRNPMVIRDYERKYCLVGTMGPNVAEGNAVVRPINLLVCNNARTYYAVKKMADRDDIGRKNAPLLVMGQAYVTTDEALGIQRPAPKKIGHIPTVYTAFRITSAAQVAPWDFDVRFEDATANQNEVQRQRKLAIANASNPQYSLL